MWFKSINLKNVYSFGKLGTPELSDFKQFNLFIGKNGSGKSNVFRVMCDLDAFSGYDSRTNTYYYQLGNESINWNITQDILKPDPNSSNDIIITLEDHKIEFRNRVHIKGNFKFYSAIYVSHDSSILSFKDKLNKIKRSKIVPKILSFSLKYIFQLDFYFQPGKISEWFTIRDDDDRGSEGKSVVNFENWSSGFFSVSNLLMDYLEADGRVICVDEPEVHVEPRILRKVFEIFIWISNRGNKSMKYKSLKLFDSIENKWLRWLETSPGESKEWRIENFKAKQIFFSSHSPVLINEFLKYPELCSIYEFDRPYQDTSVTLNFVEKPEFVQRKSVVSIVRKIGEYPHSILDNLGARGSDILQTNGVIWVEGPSDVVYIKKWLDMYAAENKLRELTQGSDYEFQMYGGTLLDSLCLMKNEHSEEDELKKLVSMFSFSRNAFVVTDSDAVVKDDGAIYDQSNFKNAKEFIAKEFEKLSENNYNLGLWYKKNNIEIRTLENYLDDKTIEEFGKQSDRRLSKKIYAQEVAKSWDDRTLTDFKFALNEEIKTLYETIIKWNR